MYLNINAKQCLPKYVNLIHFSIMDAQNNVNRDDEESWSEIERNEHEFENPIQPSEIDSLIINSVKTGNIRFLDLLLYEPGSNLNIIYYGENLLMMAIRMDQEEMGKFLLENGIEFNFEKNVFHFNKYQNMIEYFKINCREMAYRKKMYDLVEIIDFMDNNYYRFGNRPKLNMRDRTEKPGMFYDVISLHEDFFSFYIQAKTVEEIDADKVSIDIPKLLNFSKKTSQKSSYTSFVSKETKSSFLRKRASSAKNEYAATYNEGSLGIDYSHTRIKSASHFN